MKKKVETNLNELPLNLLKSLSVYLNLNNDWERLFYCTDLCNEPETILNFRNLSNPSEILLTNLGNRGCDVQGLMKLLDKAKVEKAQLVLRRTFQSVKLDDQSPDTLTVDRGSVVRLFVKTSGFPYANFLWFKDGVPIESSLNHSVLELQSNEITEIVSTFYCKVWNCIEPNEEWSEFYRKTGKRFQSEITSNIITLNIVEGSSTCDNCAAAQRVMEKFKDVMDDENILAPCSCQRPAVVSSAENLVDENDADCCLATDKVALIVSNAEYYFLPKLLTPACDGQALAEALLSCGFKTVTLVDLTLSEMQIVVHEYFRLLGSGVYALFYFVGHGFEFNGQCYLLPVDAPDKNYSCQDCLCAEEVLATMQETEPSLNVILLDVCRKYPTSVNTMNTVQFAQHKIYKPRVNRNTVFGYATSFGEGAYEIRGETNGIFMKYFKNYVGLKKPITEVLNLVIRDLENDPSATDVQFPEIRTNLSRPRSLADPMDPTGHTVTFDHRTLRWQEIHELPDPIKIRFIDFNLLATLWFDFCGHFTNMIYVFTSVSSVCAKDSQFETIQDDTSKQYLVYLKFPEGVEAVQPTVCDDMEEGVSVRTLVKHLQRFKGPLTCSVELANKSTSSVVGRENIILGKIMIAKLEQWHTVKEEIDHFVG